jgi:hypothetical protein
MEQQDNNFNLNDSSQQFQTVFFELDDERKIYQTICTMFYTILQFFKNNKINKKNVSQTINEEFVAKLIKHSDVVLPQNMSIDDTKMLEAERQWNQIVELHEKLSLERTNNYLDFSVLIKKHQNNPIFKSILSHLNKYSLSQKIPYQAQHHHHQHLQQNQQPYQFDESTRSYVDHLFSNHSNLLKSLWNTIIQTIEICSIVTEDNVLVPSIRCIDIELFNILCLQYQKLTQEEFVRTLDRFHVYMIPLEERTLCNCYYNGTFCPQCWKLEYNLQL